VENLNVAYDITSALATITSPVSSSTTNTTEAQYNLNEALQTASLVYTSTSGTDLGANYTYPLSGAELSSGSHSVQTGFSLVDGSVYDVSLQGITDLAGTRRQRSPTPASPTTWLRSSLPA